MKTKRMRWTIAGLLLLATAVTGAIVRAKAVGSNTGVTTFGSSTVGPLSFSGRLDRTAVLQGGDGVARMEVVIGADEVPSTAGFRRPTDLVIVLDRSGSMAGDKIFHARASVRELLGHLRPQDRFALVSYASDSRVDVPLTPYDEQAPARIHRTLNAIAPGGGTNMSSGLDNGLSLIGSGRTAGRVPHLILISDGLANEGDSTLTGFRSRAATAAQGEFMLSTIGVGDDFNEELMTAIADAGTGNYYYVRHAEDLAEVFAREFDAARTTVASGVALRIAPGNGVRVTDVSGYPLASVAGAVVVRPGSMFSGQVRRLWVTFAIPNHRLGDYELGELSLAYSIDSGRHEVRLDEVPVVACVKSENEYFAGFDSDVLSFSVAIEDYNAMQDDVAKKVKEGKLSEALSAVGAFRRRAGSINRQIDSAPVAAKLEELDELEAEVKQAFEGSREEQATRQNLLGKAKGAAAKDARRVGSKKAVQ